MQGLPYASPKTSLNNFSFLRKMSLSRAPPPLPPEYTPVPISPTTTPPPIVRRPKWNRNIMILIWVCQFGVGCYLESMCTFVFRSLRHDGSQRGWEVLTVIILLLNLLVLLAPLPYEIWHFRMGTLMARGYMWLQISKCIYLSLLLFWPLLILGIMAPLMMLGLPGISGGGAVAVVYFTLIFFILFCSPFVSGWVYARRVNNAFKEQGKLDAEMANIEFRDL